MSAKSSYRIQCDIPDPSMSIGEGSFRQPAYYRTIKKIISDLLSAVDTPVGYLVDILHTFHFSGLDKSGEPLQTTETGNLVIRADRLSEVVKVESVWVLQFRNVFLTAFRSTWDEYASGYPDVAILVRLSGQISTPSEHQQLVDEAKLDRVDEMRKLIRSNPRGVFRGLRYGEQTDPIVVGGKAGDEYFQGSKRKTTSGIQHVFRVERRAYRVKGGRLSHRKVVVHRQRVNGKFTRFSKQIYSEKARPKRK